jgi:glucose-1-phosphate thymidylyltransferase
MSIDTAVILAAGEGSRLTPLTEYRPKPMLPAVNRPILEYVLDALIEAGIEHIHLVVGYRATRVQSHFGPYYRDHELTYHRQETRLGSGHALLQARDAIDDDFLVVNGDEVTAARMVRSVVEAHDPGRLATLAVIESEDARHYGAVRMRGTTVEEFVERPDEGDYRLLNAGIYAFDAAVFDYVDATPRESGELGLPQTITWAMDQGETIHAVRTGGMRTEATYPWDLTELAASLLSAGLVEEPERRDGVYVSEAASVHPTATLRAPVAVAADAVVGPGAVVGPDVAVGPNTTVEANATVRRCVLDVDTRVGAGSVVCDSVTGQGAELSCGVTVPGGPGDVQIGTAVHEGRPLGCVVSDRAVLGGGVTVRPGTLVGPDARIDHGVSLHGNVDADAEVRR